jgi:hypothetical protein
LRQRGPDDENQLQPVHLLAANNVSKRTEPDLADDGSGRGSKLDGRVLGRGEGALVVLSVDDTQHNRQQRHAEDVVAVGEEAGAGHQTGAHMVPAKRRLVDFGQGQTTTLIRVLDVREVVVEVVERVVPAGRLVSHCCVKLCRCWAPR